MNKNIYNILIIIIFPYLYLFPHTFQFIEMGNDFELLYFSYKKYIYEFLKIGHLPLWSPSESLGYSLIFNPFAQYFYPLSWVLYLIALILGDLSKHIFLLYTIFGISIYGVGQYLWLKKLNISQKNALISTIIVCASLKLTETLRFPNAIHTFCWFPWILYGITLSVEKKAVLKPIIIIFFSTLFVLTAGYPYYIIYAVFFFASYFIFISVAYMKKIINFENENEKYFKFILKIIIPSIFAFIIVLPWFLGIQEIMDITRDRNLENITFSKIISSGLTDHIGSWIYPPMSQAETNYYFGAIVSLLILTYFVTFILKKNKSIFEFYFCVFFLLFFFLNFQISNSENSILFEFIWNKVDLIKNIRAFGRINILLLPLIAVIICFAIKNLSETINQKNLIKIIVIIASIILLSQFYIIEIINYNSIYWETWQGRRLNYASNYLGLFGFIFELYNNYIYSIFTVASIITLVLIIKYNLLKNLNLIILLLLIGELFILSNIQWAIPYKYYDANGYNKLEDKPLQKLQNSFTSERVSTEVKGNTYFRNQRKSNVNYFDIFGVEAHTKMYDKYFNRKGEFRDEVSIINRNKVKLLWGLNHNKKIFFSNSIAYNTIEDLVNDINKNGDNFNDRIIVDTKTYNGDEIKIEYLSQNHGYIIFMDNWSPGWEVSVNGIKKKIELVLGSYKAVKIKNGINKIIFKYKPW